MIGSIHADVIPQAVKKPVIKKVVKKKTKHVRQSTHKNSLATILKQDLEKYSR